MIHKCCCCIPIRPAVMIIAVLSSIVYISSVVSLLIHKQGIVDGVNNAPVAISGVVGVYWACVSVAILYSISSLFGVVGAIAQNRLMIGIFRVLYWIMAIVLFVVSLAAWIFLLVKKDTIVEGCGAYLQYAALSDGSMNQDACLNTVRDMLIGGGIAVFVGGLLQFYFASVISTYAKRLKANREHQRLRNTDEFPEKDLDSY